MSDFLAHISAVIDDKPFEVFGAAILLLVTGILFIPVLKKFARRIDIYDDENEKDQ